MASSFRRFIQWVKNCCSAKEAKHTKLAQEVRERSAALNQSLMEQKFKKSAQGDQQGGHTAVPTRWQHVTYGELHAYHVLATTQDSAQELPDRAWGLLNEAASVFASDGKQLSDADMEALEALVEGDVTNMPLAILHEKFTARSVAADNLRLRSMKVRGKQTEVPTQ